MADFDTGFATRHAAALADIDARIGLPYLGIDCAETQDGRLLVQSRQVLLELGGQGVPVSVVPTCDFQGVAEQRLGLCQPALL